MEHIVKVIVHGDEEDFIMKVAGLKQARLNRTSLNCISNGTLNDLVGFHLFLHDFF